jgi:hypothetical protein
MQKAVEGTVVTLLSKQHGMQMAPYIAMLIVQSHTDCSKTTPSKAYNGG